MSKVKFIEDLTLTDLPDSVSDDVAALTNTAQTISGEKVFEVILNSPASSADLATVADDELITKEQLAQHIQALKDANAKAVVSEDPIEVLPGGTYYYYQPGVALIAVIKPNPNVPGRCPFDLIITYPEWVCELKDVNGVCVLECNPR